MFSSFSNIDSTTRAADRGHRLAHPHVRVVPGTVYAVGKRLWCPLIRMVSQCSVEDAPVTVTSMR